MVTSIARQSIILKCLRQKSVMVGNYEFYYVAGLMKKLMGADVTSDLEPEPMLEKLLGQLDSLSPKDEKEEYLIKLVSTYEALGEKDEQMVELFKWGENEPDLWLVTTSHEGAEFVDRQ